MNYLAENLNEFISKFIFSYCHEWKPFKIKDFDYVTIDSLEKAKRIWHEAQFKFKALLLIQRLNYQFLPFPEYIGLDFDFYVAELFDTLFIAENCDDLELLGEIYKDKGI